MNGAMDRLRQANTEFQSAEAEYFRAVCVLGVAAKAGITALFSEAQARVDEASIGRAIKAADLSAAAYYLTESGE